LTIQAVSLDWKWLFIYPDQSIATINTLTVPAGVPLQFQLTSASVMNVFFIPQFGTMIYTMNGMTTRLNLRADSPGTFGGLSAHFSVDGWTCISMCTTCHQNNFLNLRRRPRVPTSRLMRAAINRSPSLR
jgi:heme/copper-type cytochrome/quinol oxidase subunit 2